jgi:hypothetical protein
MRSIIAHSVAISDHDLHCTYGTSSQHDLHQRNVAEIPTHRPRYETYGAMGVSSIRALLVIF